MLLEVKNGSFGYIEGQQVLNRISFSLEKGKVMTILGQNGVGKTTLLKCVLGLLKWQEGQTFLYGDPFHSIENTDLIGYVPQAHRSVFAFTVMEMTAMGRARHVPFLGSPSKVDKEKVHQALDTVGILHLKDRLCSQLSGGQLQLMYIARALVNDPDLLIMDEPESHLDFKNQYLILNLIEKLKYENGISSMINTHYPDHALKISDTTLMMGEGNYIFDESDHIITQENIRQFYDVDVRIMQVPGYHQRVKSFVVVGNHSEQKSRV